MSLGVVEQFLKRLPLVMLAGRLGDAEHLVDGPPLPDGESVQAVLLNIERVALALLFSTADPRQCDEFFHGLGSGTARESCRCPTLRRMSRADSGVNGCG